MEAEIRRLKGERRDERGAPTGIESKELSRELARKILEAHPTTTDELAFIREKLPEGVKAGIFTLSGNAPSSIELCVITEEKWPQVKGLFKAYNSVYNLSLKEPVVESVSEVTGIADSIGPEKKVEYTTKFQLPNSLSLLRPYIYTGNQHEAYFQRFDDGWRWVRSSQRTVYYGMPN